ncbi:hypothetical protein CMI48_00460 [Candidatus Pacearchaeota archaeon]|jgi:hypothetical protein|nr:hypothetical protein [Candidatus Pacearchaeota archaeon]|tara:strand:+ start:99 stop:458 length:360 start_codon:yes stop_codon:yes gene_type:complete
MTPQTAEPNLEERREEESHLVRGLNRFAAENYDSPNDGTIGFNKIHLGRFDYQEGREFRILYHDENLTVEMLPRVENLKAYFKREGIPIRERMTEGDELKMEEHSKKVLDIIKRTRAQE